MAFVADGTASAGGKTLKDSDSFAVLPAILGMTMILALVFACPFIVIWCLNTLFGLAIPFTFKTWCASFLLKGILSGNIKARVKE